MEKKKLYVTVETGEILEDQTAATYQFVIEANEQERRKLEELFEIAHDAEMNTILPAMTLAVAYHDDPENHEYDGALMNIYKELHQLGTEETRQHIESMNIL